MLKKPPKNSRERTKNLLLKLQDQICEGLETSDGKGKFTEESWQREEGGGGRSRVLKNGSIFEQAGVNFSEVHGKELPLSIISQRPEAKGMNGLPGLQFLHPKIHLFLFILIIATSRLDQFGGLEEAQILLPIILTYLM